MLLLLRNEVLLYDCLFCNVIFCEFNIMNYKLKILEIK